MRTSAHYVIVGGGSAGCVLANRLSQDPSTEVVLLEAGPIDDHPFIHMPGGFFKLMQRGTFDWGYHTEPQVHMDRRVLFWPRGRVLGGSSSINGFTYIRGDRSDYDRWAQLGNRDWGFDECLPYFKRSECFEGGASEFHGGEGTLLTSPSPVGRLSAAWIKAAEQAGHRYNPDFNGAVQDGFGPLQRTIGKARRSSSANAFIRPAERRPNLTIVTEALALRIILRGSRAVGVDFVKGNQLHTITTEHEVIVSGGAINSPQLLQLSGIGDPAHLRSVGIVPIHDLKGVGQNLQDHLAVGIKQRMKVPLSNLRYLNPVRSALIGLQYYLTHTGPAAHSGFEALGFVRTREGLAAPDVQYNGLLLLYRDHGREIIPEHGMTMYMNIQRPESRGTVLIRGADPKRHPAIQPNYLATADDKRVMRDGLRIAREVMRQDALKDFVSDEYMPGNAATSDQALDAYVRAEAETIYHPVGTCKMGNDADAVVDDRLRVRGIEQLRIVDASIMPTLVSGNTNAPTMMIAERASDFILGVAA